MHDSPNTADELLSRALAAAGQRDARLLGALDELPAPIYVTDAEGVITYFNRACIAFAGRKPLAGQDRWCVTWKLYTNDGAFLPHDACPMAEAIRHKRPVRGVTAIAERPDGTRVRFMPYPTPILGEDGTLHGAVNMLIDVSDGEPGFLRAQASKCRRLAASIGDAAAHETLAAMAAEFEAKAAALEASVPARQLN